MSARHRWTAAALCAGLQLASRASVAQSAAPNTNTNTNTNAPAPSAEPTAESTATSATSAASAASVASAAQPEAGAVRGDRATSAVAAAPAEPRATGGTAVLPNGASVVFGVGVPLMRVGALRPNDQLARERDYRIDLGIVSPGLLFHAIYNPADSFSRRGTLQVISVGGFALGQFDTQRSAQSELAVGASIYFLNATFGIGLAFDLYRGIPVLGPSGPGTDTAQTGLLSALMIRSGEFTPENIVLTLDINLVALGQAIGGAASSRTNPPTNGAAHAN